MNRKHLLRLVAVVAASLLASSACGGDGGDDGGGGAPAEPVAWVDADEDGFGVGTTGHQYLTDTPLPVRLTNERDDEVTVELFLVTPEYEGLGPPPEGAESVLTETVPAGEEVVVDVTFPTAGDYAAFVSPEPEVGTVVGSLTIPVVDE